MSGWIAGVDACRAGWIVARHEIASPHGIEIAIHPGFETILDPSDPPTIVAVDMPIGLPERVGGGGRGPERTVRPFLGARKSSVFSIPSRDAVYAEDYAIACQKAAATSEPSRKISKQAFMLFPKIMEIDSLLRTSAPAIDPPWSERVFEVHPELAFWRLNGETLLLNSKKARMGAHRAGSAERIAILLAAGIPGEILGRALPRGAAIDDMLDALAALCIARRIHAGEARPYPDPPARDDFGLPIAIWA